MAKKIYIGAEKQFTITNLLGACDDVGNRTASEPIFINQSIYKTGAQSWIFIPTADATEVTYTLRQSANTPIKPHLIPSHKYYFSAWLQQLTPSFGQGSFDFYWPVQEPVFLSGAKPDKANEWCLVSAIKERSSFAEGDYECRVDWNDAKANLGMFFDGLTLVDLTAAFGAGNEPDQAWCDANIPFTKTTATVSRGTAHNVKNMFIGVDDKARKVKKAYVGVNGVARFFFGSGELAYYGTATDLSDARSNLAATTVGNYALFGGGYSGSRVVDAYDASLTRITPTGFSNGRYNLAATTVGNYALFGGGISGSTNYAVVDAYNTSLTKSTATKLSKDRNKLAATTVGSYALFGGGYYYNASGTSSSYNTVDAYDTSLTRSTPTGLNKSCYEIAATTVGNYALFGGYYTTVTAYNTSLTRSTPTEMSNDRNRLAATTVGNYALFGGGHTSKPVNTVDAYDASLTRSIPTALSEARRFLAATTVGDYALFGGGESSRDYSGAVDAYDASLTRSTSTSLNKARGYLAATTVGNYALFGGGDSGTDRSTVDVYIIS